MVEGGGGARLLLEAADAPGVLCELGREELQRDPAAELGVEREVDLAHAARAE